MHSFSTDVYCIVILVCVKCLVSRVCLLEIIVGQ